MTIGSKLPPIHPGEILRELFLEPLNMTPYALAKRLGAPRSRVERLVKEKTSINAEMALRLGKFFKTTPELWMNMQTSYELKIHSSTLQAELAKITEIEPTEEN